MAVRGEITKYYSPATLLRGKCSTQVRRERKLTCVHKARYDPGGWRRLERALFSPLTSRVKLPGVRSAAAVRGFSFRVLCFMPTRTARKPFDEEVDKGTNFDGNVARGWMKRVDEQRRCLIVCQNAPKAARHDYNTQRPHSSIGNKTPSEVMKPIGYPGPPMTS